MAQHQLPDFDIAIVGGGISGIYTAWRMMQEGTSQSATLKKWKEERGSLKIAVFEGSKRIGGRLLSAKAPGLPDIVCELGGMRYVSSQMLVRSLVENKFKLPTKPQSVVEANNLLLLRGKNLKIGDLNNPNSLPYNFTPEEVEWLGKDGNTAANFLGYAIEKVFPDIQKHINDPLREYLTQQQVGDVPLYKIGFWNLVATQLSHEAYAIAVTSIGYDCLGFNTNAVDAICEYYDFTPNVTYKLFSNGFDSLVWTMQDAFQAAGGEVFTDTWLESFDGIQLADGSTGVAFCHKGETKPHTARAIILAMPKKSVQLLAQTGPVLNPQLAPHVQHLMSAVVGIPLYKMFIAYPFAWWGDALKTGRSITDIPIRQCYYWGTESDLATNNASENKNAVLMVYNDALSSEFWGGLRLKTTGPDGGCVDNDLLFKGEELPVPLLENEANEFDERLKENWKMYKAPKAMVAEMHRQLKILHNKQDAPASEVPEPMEASFFDWGDDPYGGAVHFWNPGYQSTQVMNDIIQPVPDFPCYMCGEAYSTNQTWAEGALQTAELVLRKFGIKEPDWITKNA